MQDKGVASGLVYKVADMLADPHFAARNAIVETPHPVFGTVKMQNAFPILSETPGGVRWPGPELGAHTEDVLQAVLGIDADEAGRLRGRGVV